jgi:hypothetical protein
MDRRPSIRHVRIAALLLVLIGLSPVATGYATSHFGEGPNPNTVPERVPPSDGITVVTIDGLGPGQIVAYAPNGSRIYRNRTHRFYHDVDPSPVGSATVTYVASSEAGASHCNTSRAGVTDCSVSVVERVNLTTGSVDRLYSRTVPDFGSDNVHDVDVIDGSRIVVADIAHPDRLYVANLSTGETVWEWRAIDRFDPSSGGDYPEDWTHLNDVEYVENDAGLGRTAGVENAVDTGDFADGLVMASVRNQDQVVFLRPGHGVVDDLTLGSEGAHERLYEQHNPDFIPRELGGPAVLVADSENNRIVEYQRTDGGTWRRTWLWRDDDTQWPRDADRLPDGHTLITNTHADRVVEVNRSGAIVWMARFPGPYEAERLGTGPESAGGPSASAADLASRNVGLNSLNGLFYGLLSLIPPLLLHATMFALPNWVTPLGAAGLLLVGATAVLWSAIEGGRIARRRRR